MHNLFLIHVHLMTWAKGVRVSRRHLHNLFLWVVSFYYRLWFEGEYSVTLVYRVLFCFVLFCFACFFVFLFVCCCFLFLFFVCLILLLLWLLVFLFFFAGICPSEACQCSTADVSCMAALSPYNGNRWTDVRSTIGFCYLSLLLFLQAHRKLACALQLTYLVSFSPYNGKRRMLVRSSLHPSFWRRRSLSLASPLSCSKVCPFCCWIEACSHHRTALWSRS